MTAYLMCITSGGGLPIFSRHRGNTENLPFSTIGSLNGVHMFGKTQQIELLNTLTEDYTFVWKEFHDSLVFIGIANGCTKQVLNQIIQCAANAIVLIVGIDEVKSQRNIERLKRELRICYPMIDRMLESLDNSSTQTKNNSDLSNLVETILTPENHLIQIVLDSYTECVDSMFSCVLIHGKIAAATESWWSLHPIELKLLSLLATIENTSIAKDIPVFLPFKSPNVAFRFVAVPLLPEVQVCCLCGPRPLLEEIEHSAAQCFKASLDILNCALDCHPRNFPDSLQLDSGVLGILLVNLKYGKYVMSKNQPPNAKRNANSHRLDVLRTFYYQAVMNVLTEESDEFNTKEIKDTLAKETYWCSEYHKCHGLRQNDNVMCVLYNAATPTQVMRQLTQITLQQLIGDKQFCY